MQVQVDLGDPESASRFRKLLTKQHPESGVEVRGDGVVLDGALTRAQFLALRKAGENYDVAWDVPLRDAHRRALAGLGDDELIIWMRAFTFQGATFPLLEGPGRLERSEFLSDLAVSMGPTFHFRIGCAVRALFRQLQFDLGNVPAYGVEVLLDLIAEFELSDLAEDLLRKLRFHPVLREPLRYDPNTTLEHHLYRVFVGVADARTQQVQLQQLLRERSAANLAAHSLIRVLPPGGAVQLLEAVWRSEEGGGQRLDKCIRTLLDNLLSHDLLFLSAHIEALMGSSNSKDHQLAFRMLAGIALHAYIKCYRKSVWKPKNKRHARTYTATASHLQVVLRLGSAEAQLNVADSCVRLVYLIVPEEPKLNLDDAVDALEKAEAMGGEATG